MGACGGQQSNAGSTNTQAEGGAATDKDDGKVPALWFAVSGDKQAVLVPSVKYGTIAESNSRYFKFRAHAPQLEENLGRPPGKLALRLNIEGWESVFHFAKTGHASFMCEFSNVSDPIFATFDFEFTKLKAEITRGDDFLLLEFPMKPGLKPERCSPDGKKRLIVQLQNRDERPIIDLITELE
jgi:hypothetical protein